MSTGTTSLRQRLASLKGTGPSRRALPAPPLVPAPAEVEVAASVPAAGWRSLLARAGRRPGTATAPVAARDPAREEGGGLPAEWEVLEGGGIRIARETLPVGARVGSRALLGPACGGRLRGLDVLARGAGGRGAPESPLVLDLETTGLGAGAGNRAWLVGLAWPENGGWQLEQLFLASPGAEGALLALVADRLARHDAVVTYNGRSFDVPLLESRFVLHRQRARVPALHLDLLATSRRLWGEGLVDLRLATVEDEVLGVMREDDLPGSEAPAAWRDWLRWAATSRLLRAVEHNRHDVAAVAALLEACADALSEAGSDADAVGVAELHASCGDLDGARRSLGGRADARSPSTGRLLRRARLVKRLDGREAAAAHWRELVGRPDAGPECWEELAKILEHDLRDAEGARAVVREALARFGRRGSVRERFERRLARLERRAARPFPPARGSG